MVTAPYRWKPGLPADRKRRRFNAKAAAQLVKLLMSGTPSMHDLVADTGLCIHTVRSYVKALHLVGACHIAGWAMDKRGAYTTPRWAVGAGVDVVKPPPVDPAAQQRASRKVLKLKAAGFRPPRPADLARAAA